MISFMILGGQRSATTWMANLLTTDNTLCIHDPLYSYTLKQLDDLHVPGKRLGIACTGSLMFDEWVRKHPAKKVLLYREPEEVNASLRQLGLAEISVMKQFELLEKAKMPVFQWDKVFDAHIAREICRILNVPFCAHRHYELRQMNIQPAFERVGVNPEAVQHLVQRIKEVLL
jgi:hypothetical protein